MVAQKGRGNLSVPKPIPLNGKATPELLPIARLAMEGMIKHGTKVLEMGSGHSTVWLAILNADVVTVENDPLWHAAVSEWLADRHLNVTQILCDAETIRYAANAYPDAYFDVLFVDGEWFNRVEFMEENIQRLKPGGWVVFDDANWASFNKIKTILADWEFFKVSGVHHRKTGISRWVLTSFYQKPVKDR